MSNEIRFISHEGGLRIESVTDNQAAFAVLDIKKEFFEFYDSSNAIDLMLKSNSIKLVFRSPRLLKKMQEIDIWMENNQQNAYIRQCNTSYKRLVIIPIEHKLQIRKINFGNFEAYPCHVRCLCKLLFNNLKHFSPSIDLVTFRVREKEIMVETGDEEAEMFTRFCFFDDEFLVYRLDSDVTSTFSLKSLRNYLNGFDKATQKIDCYFSQDRALVFTCVMPFMMTKMMMSRVQKLHGPDRPPNPPFNQSLNVTYQTTVPSRNETHQVIPGYSRTSIESRFNADISEVTASTSFQAMQGPRESTPFKIREDKSTKDTGEDMFDDDYELDDAISTLALPGVNHQVMDTSHETTSGVSSHFDESLFFQNNLDVSSLEKHRHALGLKATQRLSIMTQYISQEEDDDFDNNFVFD